MSLLTVLFLILFIVIAVVEQVGHHFSAVVASKLRMPIPFLFFHTAFIPR
jgi:hypothetical protein